MNLDELFRRYGTDKGSGAHGYAPVYEAHIDPEKVEALLEVGVLQGASLRAWRDWMPQAEVHGIDIAPVEVEGCTVHLGNVRDVSLVNRLGWFDVIIDDGSHIIDDVDLALRLLWPHLKPGGLYVIEDLAPSLYQAGLTLFLKRDAWEVHRYGEIVVGRKAP